MLHASEEFMKHKADHNCIVGIHHTLTLIVKNTSRISMYYLVISRIVTNLFWPYIQGIQISRGTLSFQPVCFKDRHLAKIVANVIVWRLDMYLLSLNKSTYAECYKF